MGNSDVTRPSSCSEVESRHPGALFWWVVAAGPAAEVLTAERLGDVYRVCVTVDIDDDDGAVIVVPRRGFPMPTEGE